MRKTLAFLISLVTAAPAIAQVPQFPQTLPPYTVVGRLGNGTGPSQAIPFSVLQSNLGGTYAAATLFGNPTAIPALGGAFTLDSLPARGTVDGVNDRLLIKNGSTGRFNYVAPINLPPTGVTSVATGTCMSGGPIIATGTVTFDTNCLSGLAMYRYTSGGTSNDTTGVQAAFTACGSFGGCRLNCAPGVTYTIDTITVSSNTYFDGAGCRFQQRTTGQNTFDLNNVTNVHFNNLYATGTATPGGGNASGASSNSAIFVRGGSSRVWLTNSDIREYKYSPLVAYTANNVNLIGNYFFENCFGPRFANVKGIVVTSNTLDRTCLYTLTPTTDQFSVGIALESTDPIGGVSYPPSETATITGNIVKQFPYGQGILVHSGYNVTIAGNSIFGSSIGISANPFNSTDFIQTITIADNAILGTAATLPPSSGDSCITVQAGGSTPNVYGPTVKGNSCYAANRKALDVSLGCYQIGFTTNLSFTGNSGGSCGANGVVFADKEEGAIVTGNAMDAIVAVSTTQNGYLWSGAPRAAMLANMVSNLAGANGIGYKIVGATTNLKWKDSGSFLMNGAYNTTTASSP